MTMIVKTGVVISDKMDKTRVVKVEHLVRVKKYGKIVKRYKKYYVHDEKNMSKTGDVVEIKLTKPISKLKRWKIINIVNKEG